MPGKIQSSLLFFVLLIFLPNAYCQLQINEKDLLGNWKVTGGSGAEWDGDVIGDIFSFEKDHKFIKTEDNCKGIMTGKWNLENNTLTIVIYYSDEPDDFDTEILSVRTCDSKKMVIYHLEEELLVNFDKMN